MIIRHTYIYILFFFKESQNDVARAPIGAPTWTGRRGEAGVQMRFGKMVDTVKSLSRTSKYFFFFSLLIFVLLTPFLSEHHEQDAW